MIWFVFWVGFWADLLRPEPEPPSNVVSFEDWRRSHRPVVPAVPPRAAA